MKHNHTLSRVPYNLYDRTCYCLSSIMDKNVCACRSVAEAFQQSQVMWDSLRGISSFEVGINRLCEGHGNGQSILGSQCHRARAARRPWEKEKEAEIQLCWLSCGSDFLNTAESGLGRFDWCIRGAEIFTRWSFTRSVWQTSQISSQLFFK